MYVCTYDTLIGSRTLSRKPYKYIFSYKLDDMIICSWWLVVLNILFNLFHCLRCFDQNFYILLTSEPDKNMVELSSQKTLYSIESNFNFMVGQYSV